MNTVGRLFSGAESSTGHSESLEFPVPGRRRARSVDSARESMHGGIFNVIGLGINNGVNNGVADSVCRDLGKTMAELDPDFDRS